MTYRYWSESVKSLKPYVPGEQIQGKTVVKLNTNENPFPPSPLVKKAIMDYLGEHATSLRLYPSVDLMELRQALAKYHGVESSQVFVGNGSDDVLAHAFQAFFRQPHPILFPDISYSFYPVYCNLFHIEYQKVALAKDFSIHVNDYLTQMYHHNGGIIIANPNAPTGLVLPAAEVLRLVQGNMQSAVVIDEAYVDYGGETVIPLIKEYKNLLVVRTFSKSRALAGLRIGYAIGDASLIQALERVKDSYNSYPVDSVAQVAAIASVEDNIYFEKQRLAVIENREWLSQQLGAIGFSVIPSSTNFVFATTSKMAAFDIANQLKEKLILVRHFKQPRIDNYLRISIGTKNECEQLIHALKEILK